MGYMLLFTGEDCMEPSAYDIREEEKVYAPKTAVWLKKFLLLRRQDPKIARYKRMAAVSTTSPSMRVIVPLGLFRKPFASCDKALSVAFTPPMSRWLTVFDVKQ
jgi:hypothetical protein